MREEYGTVLHVTENGGVKIRFENGLVGWRPYHALRVSGTRNGEPPPLPAPTPEQRRGRKLAETLGEHPVHTW